MCFHHPPSPPIFPGASPGGYLLSVTSQYNRCTFRKFFVCCVLCFPRATQQTSAVSSDFHTTVGHARAPLPGFFHPSPPVLQFLGKRTRAHCCLIHPPLCGASGLGSCHCGSPYPSSLWLFGVCSNQLALHAALARFPPAIWLICCWSSSCLFV